MLRELLSEDAGHVCLLLSMVNLTRWKQHFVKTVRHSRNSKSIFCSTPLKSPRPSPSHTVAFVQRNKWDVLGFSKSISYFLSIQNACSYLKCALLGATSFFTNNPFKQIQGRHLSPLRFPSWAGPSATGTRQPQLTASSTGLSSRYMCKRLDLSKLQHKTLLPR